jgi:hypothetical protein
MPPGEISSHYVLVTGDVTIDWNLAYHLPKGTNPKASWTPEDEGRLYWQRGGAALLADLIEKICEQPKFSVHKADALIEGSDISFEDKQFDTYNHSFALWDLDDPDEAYYSDHCRWQLPSNVKDEEDARRLVWRVREFLGFHKRKNASENANENKLPKKAELIVIDDAGYGFGADDQLKKLLNDCNWVVLKVSGKLDRIDKKELLKFVGENRSRKSIVILNINDLRSVPGAQIARGLSWERAAHDVATELKDNRHLKQLQNCQYVIISLDTAGAVVMSLPHQEFTLFYDPRFLEGDWERPNWHRMMGYTTILTASLVDQLKEIPPNVDLEASIKAGIKAGIVAMRELYRSGYLCKCTQCLKSGYEYQSQGQSHSPALVFPKEQVADYLKKLKTNDANSVIKRICHEPILLRKDWAILKHKIDLGYGLSREAARRQAETLAKQIAKNGFGNQDETTGIPSLEIGKLYTVDRLEIETLRSIQDLICGYRERGYAMDRPIPPLNLAVFGPPGAGKSFAVEQVAASVLGSSPFERMADFFSRNVKTFNLSQFDNVEAFNGALHQVRDIGLSGGLPLVFWDEFDTKMGNTPLAWLRYFLAPMQDGEFLQGEVTHAIGRCIFVFAGGTYDRMENFENVCSSDERLAQDAKVPDFISRLHGYIDVFGINPQDNSDDRYLIRRAILLRSLLYEHASLLFPNAKKERVRGHDSKGELNIDDGLLTAFLTTRIYKHNNRSLKAIIRGSAIPGKREFHRSDLPPRTLLDLHIDTGDFLEKLQKS